MTGEKSGVAPTIIVGRLTYIAPTIVQQNEILATQMCTCSIYALP